MQIESQKLEWKVSSRIGSLDNAQHTPRGGDKKVTNVGGSSGNGTSGEHTGRKHYSVGGCGWSFCVSNALLVSLRQLGIFVSHLGGKSWVVIP